MPDPAALDGNKLWDEILKAIVSAMPTQLFPLFKEVYGREYPKDTSIVVLGLETSSFEEDSKKPPSSTLMDIALLVAGTDYYHLECQMKNDNEMVIRMFAYDVRFAITHSKTMDKNTGEITLYFPHSVVIYPEKNDAIPDHLKCRVVFQDNSEHIYKIPTVKIQTYSLKEIKEKHLTLFIPYIILRLRPRIRSDCKHPLTEKELTEFVEKVILILKEESLNGYLTEREYRNYVRLFHFAVDRVLAKHSRLREEVSRMTEPLIKLPSVIEDELHTKIAEHKSKIADQKAQIAEQEAQIAEQKLQLASKDAEIRRLQELVSQLSSDTTH
ncbi:MAG: hypothetical protein J1E83_11060 [Lachnospiraceae bacterium]|nr:hypothetical protein [Lachnospiraceae bacterium]